RALAHEPADPLDDVGGPASRADDVAQYLAEHPAHGAAVAALEHTESGAGIADDGRQRLCDLVPDRRGEPPDEHEAGRVRQLLARGSELRLRVPQLRDVMAAIEPRAAVDRYGLHADGHHPPLTVLDRHLVLDVADLAATPELARGEQAPAEERVDGAEGVNLRRAVAENDVDVRADVREPAVVVREQNGVRDARERCAVKLLEIAEAHVRASPTAVAAMRHAVTESERRREQRPCGQ